MAAAHFRTLLLIGAAALALSACATTPGQKDGLRPTAAAAAISAQAQAAKTGEVQIEPAAVDASDYGLFLAGNSALSEGDSAAASKYLAQLAQSEDADTFLKERAFTAALLAGDIPLAAKLAPGDTASNESTKRLGRLTKAVEAMAQGRGQEAATALTTDFDGPPHGTAASLLAPWAQAMAGANDPMPIAIKAPDASAADLLAKYSQAELLEHAKKYKEAETAYKELYEKAQTFGLAGLGYGEFLERRGKRGEAMAIYDAMLKQNPDNPSAKLAKARLTSRGKAPPAANELQGAAQSLIGLAANLVGRQQENAFVYLRLALRLDPTRNDAWVLLGDFLQQAGDKAAARQAFMRVPTGAPEYLAARMRLAASYEADEDLSGALKIARETVAAAPDDADAQTLLANLLITSKDYEASVKVLDKLIAASSAKPNWRLNYFRAMAYERAGRWPEAEADLQKALALAPNQPEVLNYLGYSWADRGEHLPQALQMLTKAFNANPNSGAIIDSLGWAYYRMGQYDRAVQQLERAVMIEPADPDINNHLGDAYWRVGRQLEARYQWQRVLTLRPDDKLKAEAEGKIASGLPASPPLKTAAAAGS
ncbi:MAG TPA: tetratricopeptide repeat protein [Caulobacteraceae bacterium]|nr:tetratricopeptide repeat protein [Caulobacteraceae bacterium]